MFFHKSPLFAAAVMFAACSCSSGGPEPVRTGTPAYYWQVAMDNYRSGDYAKAGDWVEKITRANKNDFTAKAWVLRLAILSGLIRGNAELADQFEFGEKSNTANPMRFHKHVSDHRGEAVRSAMNFYEAFGEFEKTLPDGDLPADFPFPGKGSISMPLAISKIQIGQMPPDSDIETVSAQMSQRGVIEQVCELMGAPGDAAKAQAALKTTPVTLPRAQFELAMARTLYDISRIYSVKKAADSVKQEAFCNLAAKSLERAGEGKDVKDLKDKIAKDLKEIKARRG